VRLLEREAELDQLNKLFEQAGEGRGHVVLIRGEAGMGKTSLVREFMTSVEGRSHLLVGACDDLLAQRPLAAIRDMSLQEPELATALEAGTSSVYATVMTLLGRALRPTLMVIEDVHWADDATLDLIRHVGRRIGDSHALLILTYRDEDVATDHPLRSILSDLPAKVVDRTVLPPLSRAAIETLAADMGGNVDRAYTESGGNPFLATELLDSQGGVLPASIVESIAGRMGRLSLSTRELAELISVVPGRTPLDLIKAEFADWAATLDEAEKRGVLVLNPPNVSFRHELARRAVESNLTAAKRIELNTRVLAYMVKRPFERARIIHHAANAGNHDVLLEFSPPAAREAMRVGSNSQAVQYFETLRHHYDKLPPAERAGFLEDWSYAAHVVNLLTDALARSEEAITIRRSLGNQPRACLRVQLPGPAQDARFPP
jgi:predicted ATPase